MTGRTPPGPRPSGPPCWRRTPAGKERPGSSLEASGTPAAEDQDETHTGWCSSDGQLKTTNENERVQSESDGQLKTTNENERVQSESDGQLKTTNENESTIREYRSEREGWRWMDGWMRERE